MRSGPGRPVWSGWLIGACLGVLWGLYAFPRVRYALLAQCQFAFIDDSVLLIRTLDSRRLASEIPHLDRVASSDPGDYLLQVGRATALADDGGLRKGDRSVRSLDESDHTILRVGRVARDFPNVRGAYAHLPRYMSGSIIRLPRAPNANTMAFSSTGPSGKAGTSRGAVPAESDPTAPHRPTPGQVRIMLQALTAGERGDTGNAFWPAMEAVTYFADDAPGPALEALGRIRLKGSWDSYLYEEVLGKWKLYSLAYGDNGAAQKIGPLSFTAFPHVTELLHMAVLARGYADRAEREHEDRKAYAIRRNLMRLGLILRDESHWSMEALAGATMYLIATTDSHATADGLLLTINSLVNNEKQWEERATGFLGLARRAGSHRALEAIRREVGACIALRQQVDLVRDNASYPGIPPGIPLAPLFGNWIAGILVLQEIIALCLAAGVAGFYGRYRLPGTIARLIRLTGLTLLIGATGTSLSLGLLGIPTPRTAIIFLVGSTILILFAVEKLHRALMNRVARRLDPDDPGADTPDNPLVEEAEASSCWTSKTTVQMLTVLLVPGLVALFLLRPALSNLHPVAVLLRTMIGGPRTMSAAQAVQVALLITALPIGIVLMASFWGVWRRVSPIASAATAIRRLLLPAMACLLVTYLTLMNLTLRYDAEASSAIETVAKNDLHWVLTRSEPPSDE